MKIKKLLASVLATAIAASAMATTAFAADTVIFEGNGEGKAWGQAVILKTLKNDDGVLDPEIFVEGTEVVVEYTPAAAIADGEFNIELIFQSWTEGVAESSKWAKIAATTDDGKTATFSYADIIAAFPDDIATYLDALNVGAGHVGIAVSKVTLRTAAAETPDTETPDTETPDTETPTDDKDNGNANTGDAGIAALAVLSGLAVAGLVVAKKRK